MAPWNVVSSSAPVPAVRSQHVVPTGTSAVSQMQHNDCPTKGCAGAALSEAHPAQTSAARSEETIHGAHYVHERYTYAPPEATEVEEATEVPPSFVKQLWNKLPSWPTLSSGNPALPPEDTLQSSRELARGAPLPRSLQRPQVSLMNLRDSFQTRQVAGIDHQKVVALKKSWEVEVSEGVSPDKFDKVLEVYLRKLNARLTVGDYAEDLRDQLHQQFSQVSLTKTGDNACARIRMTNGSVIIIAKMNNIGKVDMGLLLSEQVSVDDYSQALVEWEIATEVLAQMKLLDKH